jgi:tetratricopeptide (TPR) repeat protein
MHWQRLCFLVFAIAAPAFIAAADQSDQKPSFDELAQQANSELQSDPARAAVLYQRALELKPSWAEGWFYLGASLYRRHDYPGSKSSFQRASELDPAHGTIWAFLGLAEIELNEGEQALKDIIKGELLGLADQPAFVSTVRNRAAEVCVRNSDFSAAIDQLQPLAQARDTSPQTIQSLGVAVLGISTPPAKLPDSKEKLILLAGRVAWNLYSDQRSEADALSSELISKYPSEPGVHYLRGLCLLNTNSEAAIAEFRTELRYSPSYVPARLQVAMLLIKQHHTEQAIEPAKEALHLDPQSALGHLVMGRILLDTRQISGAIPEFQIASRLAPANPQAHFYLAKAYRSLGRDDEARKEKLRFDELNALKNPSLLDRDSATIETGGADGK